MAKTAERYIVLDLSHDSFGNHVGSVGEDNVLCLDGYFKIVGGSNRDIAGVAMNLLGRIVDTWRDHG